MRAFKLSAMVLIVAGLAWSARGQDASTHLIVRTAKSGAWSDPSTWDGHVVPAPASIVLVCPKHVVIYDAFSDAVIRSVHVGGVLRFARDRDTRLCVGLLRIAPGEETPEEGFDCHAPPAAESDSANPAGSLLEIGTPSDPMPAAHVADIRLTHISGMDRTSFPAMVCCKGGRIDIHGAPLSRTWVKLAKPSINAGDAELPLAERVTGWRKGDKVIITGTRRQWPGRYKSVIDHPQTEEAIIQDLRDVDGRTIVSLNDPPINAHDGGPDLAAEVANLTRNVIIESADPAGIRGHTMVHAHGFASISYAEFRHLGKKGVLGRYPIHFHLCGDTARGSSVIGASIWDSENRCVNIHGTQYLVVQDCIGYRSMGHAFYFEDGTEVDNILDRNLAVMVMRADKNNDQVLPYDQNDGAGFWWANSGNAFTRNVAVECDQHGYRFEVVADERFNPVLSIRQPDGTRKPTDIRKIPFIRFDDNETHCQRRFGFNLGGFNGLSMVTRYEEPIRQDVAGVGPDGKHPFILRRTKIWDCDWGYHAGSPSVLVEGMLITRSLYGVWRINGQRQEWNDLELHDLKAASIYHPRNGIEPLAPGETDTIDPVDDLPPVTVITSVHRQADGSIDVSGFATDNRMIKEVNVNGRPAKPISPNFARWQILLPAPAAPGGKIVAFSTDTVGNRELTPHTILLPK